MLKKLNEECISSYVLVPARCCKPSVQQIQQPAAVDRQTCLDLALVSVTIARVVVVQILELPDPREVFRADQDVHRARVPGARLPQPRRHAARQARPGVFVDPSMSTIRPRSRGFQPGLSGCRREHRPEPRGDPPRRRSPPRPAAPRVSSSPATVVRTGQQPERPARAPAPAAALGAWRPARPHQAAPRCAHTGGAGLSCRPAAGWAAGQRNLHSAHVRRRMADGRFRARRSVTGSGDPGLTSAASGTQAGQGSAACQPEKSLRYAFVTLSLRSRYALIALSLRSRCALVALSLRSRCALVALSLRSRCALVALSLRSRCALVALSLRSLLQDGARLAAAAGSRI